MAEKQDATNELDIGAGYPIFQMAKALLTSEKHEDATTRQRAQTKISKWLSVIAGMLSGQFQIGSRRPIKDVPVWATPEVVTGGFVTGALLAGGPLRDHEFQWLGGLPVTAPKPHTRRVLNSYFLSDDGLAKLQERLDSGCYDLAVPEEGALLVVAWLASHGMGHVARQILDAIGSHLSELRFYPIPTQQPFNNGDRVNLENVATVGKRLAVVKPNQSIVVQKESVEVWLPLYDRMVGLLLQTVQGDIPSLAKDENGNVRKPVNGKFTVEGGWPCQVFPDGWTRRAQGLLDEFDAARRVNLDSSKPVRTKSRLTELRALLARCVANPKSLSGRDVGKIRVILAGFVAKRGDPRSQECTENRARQQRGVDKPMFFDVARAIAPRLAKYAQDGGIEDLAPVTQPITEGEADASKVRAGTPIPKNLARKIERCVSDSLAGLVERQIITSGETLARVLPQTTSNIRAAAFADGSLRALYAAIYRAFRRRRSLLLLNLQSQVKIEELPWIAAIESLRQNDEAAKEAALRCLTEVSALVLRAFPQVIVPNKLLQELRALVKEVNLTLPLVDELAADIFMGQFGPKFVASAKSAAKVLDGSLYQAYYGIDWREITDLPDEPEAVRSTKRWSGGDKLLRICERRAGVKYGGYRPAENGMIIEQQQILTTQNLAALFETLSLGATLRHDLYGMAQSCFRWICRRQQAKTVQWHAALITVKNTAYAWRQMIFYLSALPRERVDEFLIWVSDELGKQPQDLHKRFAPVLRGLELAAAGVSLDTEAAHGEGCRRFLGWSNEKHWLLAHRNQK